MDNAGEPLPKHKGGLDSSLSCQTVKNSPSTYILPNVSLRRERGGQSSHKMSLIILPRAWGAYWTVLLIRGLSNLQLASGSPLSCSAAYQREDKIISDKRGAHWAAWEWKNGISFYFYLSSPPPKRMSHFLSCQTHNLFFQESALRIQFVKLDNRLRIHIKRKSSFGDFIFLKKIKQRVFKWWLEGIWK